MSTSLVAAAVAVLVLVLLELALGEVEPDAVVVLGAAAPPVTRLPVPLTAPLVVDVGDAAMVLPVPLTAVLVPLGVGVAVAVEVGVEVAVGLVAVVVVPCTGADVPLAAVPEPLTVAAFTVVDPAALTAPEPLFVALTVVEPDACVMAVCANAELPYAMVNSAVLTAAATMLLGCFNVLIGISLLSKMTGYVFDARVSRKCRFITVR